MEAHGAASSTSELRTCGGLGLLSDTITARIECVLPPNFEVGETKRVKT